MPKYKRKVGTVEAVQWFKDGDHPLVKHATKFPTWDTIHLPYSYYIETVSGLARVYESDWIVTISPTDTYPVTNKVFKTLYEEVDEGKV